jgi:hypothetical protein
MHLASSSFIHCDLRTNVHDALESMILRIT